MKKGLMVLVASAVMCSVAFASPTVNEPSLTGLNVTEHAALFGEGSTAQVVALDGTEMKATEGEFVPFLWAIGVTYATYANAPSWNNSKVYTKPLPMVTRTQYVGGMFVHYSK